MRKIMYMNHRFLKFNLVQDLITPYTDYNWTHFCTLADFSPGIDSHYIRHGKNTLPFVNALADQMPVPNYKNISFEHASDIQSLRFREYAKKLPLLVLWSGGIDSTVILTSILKNFSQDELSNVHVACNRISVYEYPDFFYKHVQPNFKLVDSSNIKFDSELLEKYYVIDGDPGDQLYVGGTVQKLFLHNIQAFAQPLNKNNVLQSLAPLNNPAFADWLYDVIIKNAESTCIALETVYDFFWWYSFNCMWTSIKMRAFTTQTNITPESIKLYFSNFITWYDSPEYQQWSMSATTQDKINFTLPGTKLPSKEYIYNYTKDYHYYKFKFKQVSSGHATSQYIAPWVCMLDDYSCLDPNRDFDLILELLPQHIQQDYFKS